MNKDNIKHIFSAYINKFEYINNLSNDENYKWRIATEFRELMDETLKQTTKNDFVNALKKVKKCSHNMIDNYIQPFEGLIQVADKNDEAANQVKSIFIDLYADDEGDLNKQELIIDQFLIKANELVNKYFPDSFRYKQDYHAVSAYLFLYAPETHYLFKASEATLFSNCIEFYEQWGSGTNIDLSVFYKMCDWIVDQIKTFDPLVKTDASRFEIEKGLHNDKNKHILVFDIIYCNRAYELYEGIPFTQVTSKERKIIIEKQKEALKLYDNYNEACKQQELLIKAELQIKELLKPGTKVIHKKYGEKVIIGCTDSEITITDSNTPFGIVVTFENGILKLTDTSAQLAVKSLLPLLKNKIAINMAVLSVEKQLLPYREYLN